MSKITHNLLQGGRFAQIFSTIRPIFIWIKNLTSIVPTRHAINRFRSGTKMGKIARHVFSHQHINKILGTNLALAVLTTSTFQIPTLNNSVEAKDIEVSSVINTDTLALVTQKGVRLPVKERRVTQGYTIFHPGVDLDGITGDPVWPIMDGQIEATQNASFAYGKAVLVSHGNGITSLYAHLSKINVKTGQQVTTNTIIGQMGATGRASGDHLHLEVRDHGTAINPVTLLPQSR